MTDLNSYEESLAIDLAKAEARIEQLAATCEKLESDYAEACNEAAECYYKQCVAEAKLTKAVTALRFCSAAFNSSGNITERHLKICNAAVNADAALAEMEGK